MPICLSTYAPARDGLTDSSEALRACFAAAAAESNPTVVIEAGRYLVDTTEPIALGSHLTVRAEGAVFLFPQQLGDCRHRQLFVGENVEEIAWYGGHFVGYVYDPSSATNVWEPSDYTGCIRIHTRGEGAVRRVLFRDLTAENVAGAVIHVRGRNDCYAEGVDVRDCRFENCGKFMWDYGYLWQRAVFASEYDPQTVENAFRYLPKAHISSPLRLEDGRLFADVMPKAMPEERDAVSFFGEELPSGIKRGKQYFVLNKGAENGLQISETEFGEPLVLTDMPDGTRLFRNMFYLFHDLFSPVGTTAHEKGSVDVTKCRNVTISGCNLSASGDSMHILECENVLFSGNRITGARMGAFYIGFYCKNVTAIGNTVYGTNGSRVMSVERSCENVVVSGNLFVGGGRGSWINQPKNIVISDNVFIRNTQKCTADLQIGRICQATGDFERYPELYFTTWQPDATYGPIIVRGNIFETDETASAAIAFNAGGRDILLDGNILRGEMRDIHVANGCQLPLMRDNIGFGPILDRTFVNTANVR